MSIKCSKVYPRTEKVPWDGVMDLNSISYAMIVESLLRFVLQALTWMTETRKLGAYCFYDNKPEVIYGYTIQQQTKQWYYSNQHYPELT